MKSGKEIKIKTNNPNFKALAGAIIEYKAPKSIYLNISSWLKLKNDSENIDNIIRKLSGIIRKEIFNYLDYHPIFDGLKTIVDFDLSSLGLKNNKPAYLSIEINLTQKDTLLPLIKLKNENKEDLVPYITEIINHVVNLECITNNQNFKFNLKKKI